MLATWLVQRWLTQKAKLVVHGNALQSSLVEHLLTSMASAPLGNVENNDTPAKTSIFIQLFFKNQPKMFQND